MQRTVVVGAGVIGLACAYALHRRGRQVVVIDRGLPGGACSSGNAGWIVPSLSGPLPAPGVALTTIKWMTRSDSPFYLAPGAVPRLTRWLWRFWRHCNQRDYLNGLAAVAALNRTTLPLFERLQREGVSFELHRSGLLFVFLDPGYMRKAIAEFAHFEAFGYGRPVSLHQPQLKTMEPLLSDRVTSGFLVEAECHVRPESLTGAYASTLAAQGVEIRTGVEIVGARSRNGRGQVLETSSGPIDAGEILIAAGAWSGQVARHFAVELPVQAGKGYSITVDTATSPFNRPLYLGEARVGCSPFAGAIRFAGTMELSGINTRLDRRRVAGMRRGIARYLDLSLGESDGIEWVGMRPITPDGLPMLGRLPGLENVYLATGHAMLGVTLAPATAEAMADLMTGTTPAPELTAFEPGRFRW